MLEDDYIINRLLHLCAKKNISRYRLAQLSGISQSSISNLITRKSIPNILTLEKLCDGLGMTLSQFFANDEEIVDLTADQMELLVEWNELSEHEKSLVKAYIKGLEHKGDTK